MSKKSEKSVRTTVNAKGAAGKNRRVLFVRHAQRLDRYLQDAYAYLGKDWVNQCFVNDKYRQLNIEMPINLPKRAPMYHYNNDPPLTTMGEMCAQLVGNRLAESGLLIDLVYSSPALRCVETAHRIIQGYNDVMGNTPLKIRVEAGLYEFGGFTGAPPKFCAVEFLKTRGLKIDNLYKSLVNPDDLLHLAFEDFADYSKRSAEAFKYMVHTKGNTARTILMVTHGPAMISFTRQMLKKPLGSNYDCMNKIANKPAYVSSILMEETSANNWCLCDPQPLPSFEIRAHPSFNPKWFDKTKYDVT